MAEGLESFNEDTQRAKVAAGYKGGDMFKNPMLHPAMSIEAAPAELTGKYMPGTIPQEQPSNPWFSRK